MKLNEKITEIDAKELKGFVKYINDFYGKKGIYPNKYGKDIQPRDIIKAINSVDNKHPKHEWEWDSLDRELVRDELMKMRLFDYPTQESAMKELKEVGQIFEGEGSLEESSVKPKEKISKKDWAKIAKFNKHIGQDGTHYVMKYDDKIGTYLQAVVVEGESVEEEIKVGKMVKVVDNPHWEAALGKKGPFKRKVKGIYGDSVFFTDGSNSSMKYVKESTESVDENELPGQIPSQIKVKLEKAVDQIKSSKLSYVQRLKVLSQVLDGLGIDKKELTKATTKLKGTLESTVEEALSVDPRKVYGGTGAKEGMVLVAQKGLEKILDLSKKNPSNVFLVSDDNYTNFGPYYVKNGKVAKYTVANPNYDLEKNKVRSLKVKSDVILKFKIVEGVDESVNEASLKPKKLTQLKKGEKFVFNNNPYEFIELYTDIPNAAKVKKEDGKTSVVSFGGGVVNKNTKGGFSDYLKQGGRVWDNVNPTDSPSVNEVASRTAVEIGGLTGMSRDFIQKFVDTHNLDIEKVFQFVKKGNLKDRMDFVTGLAGKPNNPYQTKLIKMFGESVNEDTKKRFEVDFYKGNGDRQTSHEEIIRGDKFSDVISQATKVAKSKGMNYVEFYYKDAFIGSIDRRNGYEFKKGRNSEKSPLSVNEGQLNVGDTIKVQAGNTLQKMNTLDDKWKVIKKDNSTYTLKKVGSGMKVRHYQTKVDYLIARPGQSQLPFVVETVDETVTEARGVGTIQKEYGKTLELMKQHLELYKNSKGTPEEKKHIKHLLDLTNKKKALEKELNDKVSGMYKDAEYQGPKE